jgi:hypothetical protein
VYKDICKIIPLNLPQQVLFCLGIYFVKRETEKPQAIRILKGMLKEYLEYDKQQGNLPTWSVYEILQILLTKDFQEGDQADLDQIRKCLIEGNLFTAVSQMERPHFERGIKLLTQESVFDRYNLQGNLYQEEGEQDPCFEFIDSLINNSE